MHYTIYKTTNLVNGKIYIGCHKTKDLEDDYIGSGKLLKRAVEKYGIENFVKEILFVYDNPDEMFDKESILVNEQFVEDENTYNLKTGGQGGFDYLNGSGKAYRLSKGNLPETHQEYSSKGGKGAVERRVGWFSESAKDNSKKALKEKWPEGTWKDRTHKQESKDKIGESNSIAQAGERNSQYGTIWITDGNKPIKHRKDEPIPEGYRRGRK